METGCRRFVDLVTILVLGGLCLIVSALTLMPSPEQGQREARLAVTFHKVQQIERRLPANAQPGPIPDQEDVWGHVYWLEIDEKGDRKVVSAGPNGVSPEGSFDADDIHSRMKESPALPIARRKQLQFLLALAVALAAWILLTWLYLKPRRKSDEPDYVYSHERQTPDSP